MKRKSIIGLLVVLAFSLLGGSILLAQRGRVIVTPGARAMMLNVDNGRARLGVRLTDVSADKVRELKLSGEYGAVVTEVEENSAAAKAGLAANDVILEFDGEHVRSVPQLRRLVQDTPAGRTVAVKISRAGETRTLNVKLEAASSEQDLREIEIPQVEVPDIHMPDMNFDFFNDGPRLGISADDLTPQLAEHLGVTQGKGVLVLEVTPGSAAEKAGLKAGDCITKVGTDPVESVSDLHRALGRSSDSKEKREVVLTIVRDRRDQTLTVQLETSHHMMMMAMPRRIAGNELIGIDPDELISLKENLRANSLALQQARKDLERERHNLMEERQRMLKELRREIDKKSLETSSWVID